jgi:hypothetical protein
MVSPHGLLGFGKLLMDIFLEIADYLAPKDKAALALVCRALLDVLGINSLEA